MRDETKYLDENGNDLGFGGYINGQWIPEPNEIIAAKKDGSWCRMNDASVKSPRFP
ncbi:MAG: hypothetical protein LBR80_03260 [Deltaproteobacteria bacterium]|jgi:hypothetical protein|nr:hypothetical protein [Deltaproteobacteria bacterium]